MKGKLSEEAHTSRPWWIHEIADGFTVQDVWLLDTPGTREDFPSLVLQIGSLNFPDRSSKVVKLLWAVRWRLGALFGWDKAATTVGSRVTSLRARVPEPVRSRPPGPSFGPFTSVFHDQVEWAAEMANATVHTVMHVGWVPDEAGVYRAQMTVLVKPNGLLGRAYFLLIDPFRYYLVFPALRRHIERQWRQRS